MGTLLGVSGLASKPISEVGFEATVVAAVTDTVVLVGDALAGDDDVEEVGGSDEAAAAAVETNLLLGQHWIHFLYSLLRFRLGRWWLRCWFLTLDRLFYGHGFDKFNNCSSFQMFGDDRLRHDSN